MKTARAAATACFHAWSRLITIPRVSKRGEPAGSSTQVAPHAGRQNDADDDASDDGSLARDTPAGSIVSSRSVLAESSGVQQLVACTDARRRAEAGPPCAESRSVSVLAQDGMRPSLLSGQWHVQDSDGNEFVYVLVHRRDDTVAGNAYTKFAFDQGQRGVDFQGSFYEHDCFSWYEDESGALGIGSFRCRVSMDSACFNGSGRLTSGRVVNFMGVPDRRGPNGAQSQEDNGTETRFLPTSIQGIRVVFASARGSAYLVDDGERLVGTDGLAYRFTKRLGDRDPDRSVAWGSTVQGVDERDGWIRVAVSVGHHHRGHNDQSSRGAANPGNQRASSGPSLARPQTLTSRIGDLLGAQATSAVTAAQDYFDPGTAPRDLPQGLARATSSLVSGAVELVRQPALAIAEDDHPTAVSVAAGVALGLGSAIQGVAGTVYHLGAGLYMQARINRRREQQMERQRRLELGYYDHWDDHDDDLD